VTDVTAAIARLIYQQQTGHDWHTAAVDPGTDERYLAQARRDITIIEWPTMEFAYMLLTRRGAQCLFDDSQAVRAVVHRSPYHYTVANRCCDSDECLLAAVDLTLHFIQFDREVNHRGGANGNEVQ
jgi:hypothetical protein